MSNQNKTIVVNVPGEKPDTFNAMAMVVEVVIALGVIGLVLLGVLS